MSDLSNADPAARIAALADQCVMCGLCLPHCPTYRVQAVEGESPRGRIALARALAAGTLSAGPALIEHLDQCLGCLHCQAVCPSNVDYAGLLGETRILLRQHRAEAPLGRRLRHVLERPAWLGIASAILSAAQRLGLTRLLLGSVRSSRNGLRRGLAELPPIPRGPALPKLSRAVGERRGSVGLFPGCVAGILDRDTHGAAIRLLTALGYDVHLPAKPSCCGALARHGGDSAAVLRLRQDTLGQFRGLALDTVLGSSSGCHGALREIFSGSGIAFADLGTFLHADPNWRYLQFQALPRRAVLHRPCTQANLVGDVDAFPRLLKSIPDLQLLDLPKQPGCCGAAGSYFLEHAAVADRLRDERLEQIGSVQPDFLLTSNIGCRIFLGNGLGRRPGRIPARHPLAVLAEQLLPAKTP